MTRVAASDYLLVGPFGKYYSFEESVERRLQMEMWLAEHSTGEVQKRALEKCQEYVDLLEGKGSRKRRRSKDA